MSFQRVVITGLGAVTSIGIGIDEYTEGLREGKNGISEITAFNTEGFPSTKACQVHNFDAAKWVKKIDSKKIGRTSQFCVSASRMAVEEAGINLSREKRKRCGVVVGTTDGESVPLEMLTAQWVNRGIEHIDLEMVKKVSADNIAVSVAQELEFGGEVITISTACAAGNYAIGTAFDIVRTGEFDFMLCGGADSLCRKTFAGFLRLGTIARDLCKPFDVNRSGILTGEGAGMLFLETLESALARGARIYAEVLGYGINCDANHMVAPDKNSIVNCMELAHSNAGIKSEEVDYICAHGTGTQANDLTEAMALNEVFNGNPPPTSSIKSMLGHTMGAASALGAIACVVGLEKGFIPPTINCENPDPKCELDPVPNYAREAKLNVVQNDGFAFGGNNAILILGRHDRQIA